MLGHLVSSVASPLGLQVATASMFPPMAPSLDAGTPGVSFSYKNTSSVGLGPHPYYLM